MATRTSSSITFDGPFFRKDPARTFRQNIRDLSDRFAAEGEADVRQQMRAGEVARRPIAAGVSPSRVSAHVVGRTSSLAGRRWAVTAVVSVQNAGFTKRQGTALMAAAARVEAETHAFRRTVSRLRRGRRQIEAELFEGIG